MSRAFFDVTCLGAGVLYSLPASGVVVIGGAPEADIRVEGLDAAHLRFDAATRQLEVLGAGVRLGEQVVAPGTLRPLEPDEIVEVGGARLVYVAWQPVAARALSSHEYFEQRAAEECVRASRRKTAFSVVRVRVGLTLAASEVESVLASSVRLTDVLSLYAPGTYEMLLFDTDEAGAELVIGRLRRVLQHLDGGAVVGVAHFPKHGQSVDELTAAVTTSISGSDHTLADDSFAVTVKGADDLVARVARSSLNVLILGETGSGKEVLAARVHQLSGRGGRPFLKLNCSALSETLLESELFGHEKGSFTGAHALKQGLLETADGGTVFLDEVGELPLAMQARLLRVLEEHVVWRVGGLKSHPIDVRFVAATNRDLEQAVDRGRFRADLYFRLDGVTLVVPPLRERMPEFVSLAFDLLREASAKMARPHTPRLAEGALALLKRYHWPGNIRELRNVLERALLLTDEDEIQLQHLPLEKLTTRFAALRPLGPSSSPSDPAPSPTPAPEPAQLSVAVGVVEPPPSRPSSAPPPSRPEGAPSPARRRGLGLLASAEQRAAIEARERATIEEALLANAGNQSRAAEALGVSRRTLVKRIADYGIARPRKG